MMSPTQPALSAAADQCSDTTLPQGVGPAIHAMQGCPIWHSQQLFADASELFIEHAGALYRLRITQANKLILTK